MADNRAPHSVWLARRTSKGPLTSGEVPHLPPRRRRFSRQEERGRMKVIARIVPEVLQPILRQRSPSEVELLYNWRAIAGDLAAHTRPGSLRFPDRRTRLGAVLDIHVVSGFAPEVQHRAPEIISAINGFLGYPRAVERLRLVQSLDTERGKR